MKRLLIVLLSLFMFGISAAAAQVVPCEPPPPCPMDAPCPAIPECVPVQPGVFTNPDWLKVEYHRVNVTIEDQIARTNVDMRFVNEGNGLAEGTFVFPLPQGAAVEELVMYITDSTRRIATDYHHLFAGIDCR
jgi:hypothetical protein